MIGSRIRELRKDRKINLVDMAEKVGLSPSYLSQIERGLINPSLASLRKVARELNVPIYEFLKDEDEKGILIKKDKRIKLELPDTDIVYEFLTPTKLRNCLLYTSPSPRDRQKSRMPSSA